MGSAPTSGVAAASQPKRREPFSQRLLAEWLAATYPSGRKIFNPRLGPLPLYIAGKLPDDVSPNILSSYRRYVDAIVIMADRVDLIEAKGIADASALGQLPIYVELLDQNRKEYGIANQPIKPVLLAGAIDATLSNRAQNQGIKVVVYSPPWFLEKINSEVFGANSGVARTPLPPSLGRKS